MSWTNYAYSHNIYLTYELWKHLSKHGKKLVKSTNRDIAHPALRVPALSALCIPLTLCLCRDALASPLESSSATIYFAASHQSKTSKPSLTATKSDINAKWFDDYPALDNGNFFDFGISLPWWNLTLDYRNRALGGHHRGAASKRVGFLWVDTSFLSGISANDTVKYELQFHELGIGKKYTPVDGTWVVPKFGMNVIDAELTASGAGSSQTKTGLLPLPYVGLNWTQRLHNRVTTEVDLRYSRLSSSTAAISFKENQFSISYEPIKFVQLSLGYSVFNLTASYKKSYTDIRLTTPDKSPFVRVSVYY